MSESDHQDTNGTANAAANGDVPEIELIIKEEYICTNEALPDETSSAFHRITVDKDCIEEFIKVENECLREVKEECQENAYDIPIKEKDEHFTDEGYTTSIAESIQRSSSITSSTAIEYAIAVAEACDGYDDDKDDDDEDNDVVNDGDIENDSDAGSVREKTPTNIRNNKNENKNENKKSRLPLDETIMLKAIHEVLNEGLSITQAAKKYNLVKSTLWMRIGKQPICPKRNRAHRPVIDSAICSKLLNGASLSETARSLRVSKATIYRHKQQLIEMGALNNEALINSPLRQRYAQAHRACRMNGMSVRFAAKFFSLPIATLWRFIKKNQNQSETENFAQPQLEDDDVIQNEDSVSRLNEAADGINVLKEVQINSEINVKNQLMFEIGDSFESMEESSVEGSRNIKTENDFDGLEDDMIFEDELLIRILK